MNRPNEVIMNLKKLIERRRGSRLSMSAAKPKAPAPAPATPKPEPTAPATAPTPAQPEPELPKDERLAKRTAYCDEHDIQGDAREKILKGRISIEEFEALQKSATEITEAPEQPAEESVEVQTDVTMAEPEEAPKKKKSYYKSHKKSA